MSWPVSLILVLAAESQGLDAMVMGLSMVSHVDQLGPDWTDPASTALKRACDALSKTLGFAGHQEGVATAG